MIFVLAGLSFGANPGFAACSLTAGLYTCSGNTSIQTSLNGSPLSVNLDETFINPSNLHINTVVLNTPAGTGGLTLNQAAGSSIFGSLAISTQNLGTGASEIATAGAVTGWDATALSIQNSNAANTGGISFTQSAGRIQGPGNSLGSTTLAIDNAGLGASTLRFVSGRLEGYYAVSVNTYNPANTGGFSVTQDAGSTITAGYYGVSAINNGIGPSTITSAGNISSAEINNAIFVYNANPANAAPITINQTGGTIAGADIGIQTLAFGTETTHITIGGTVTGGPLHAAIWAGSYGTSSPINIVLNQGANVSATSGAAITSDTGNTNVILNSGSKVTGAIRLFGQDNAVTVTGTSDITQLTELLGGNVLDSGDNHLTFLSTTQQLAGSVPANWHTITLNRSAVTLSDGGLRCDIASGNGIFLINNAVLASAPALNLHANVNIDASSLLTHAAGGNIRGNLSNAGLVYWQNLGQTLTVNGNYTGLSGSRISLETALGGDTSATDKMQISGNTSGTTRIAVRPVAGSAGAQTATGIKLVQVDGSSAADSFTLAAPVNAGAFQYRLKQGSADDTNDWYLVSSFRPGVANYVSGQTANVEQGFLQLGSLHQRIGDQRSVHPDGRQSWMRAYHTKQANNGEMRFGYQQRTTGFQLGQEILVRNLDDEGKDRAALAIDYANSTALFSDRLRPLENAETSTGRMDAQSVAVGAYYTRIDKHGSYFDLVGQISSLRNKFQDSDGNPATQNGWRTAISGEVGWPAARLGDWTVEPQAQLSYQHANYRAFNDPIASISAYAASTFRARIGVRLFDTVRTADQKDVVYYGIANIIQTLNRPQAVKIGATSVNERFEERYGELGFGVQGWIRKSTYLYGQLRYQHAFAGHTDGTEFQLGMKIEL